MFYFIHILAGATIAKFFPNFFIIFILSLTSHFILDVIPHRDSFFDRKSFASSYKIKITKKAVFFQLADMFVTLLLIVYIQIKFNSMLILFSIFISLLPDIVRIFYLTGLKDNKIFKKYMFFHSKIQKDTTWSFGILIQLTITVVLLKILF